MSSAIVAADRAVVDILAALVGFDTTSRNSNLALIDWVEAYLARHGVASRRIPDETGRKANLWATIGPPDVPGYVLSGHTDVVPVDDQDWSTDPFRLTERDGLVYGRGTTDMKGFLAACLAQVPAMVARPLRAPIHLAFSYDEEVGCLGVRGLLSWLAGGVRPLACFVGEPTSMQVVVAHKGKRSVRVSVRGRTCHSSLAPIGVNAVEYAALLVAHIRGIGGHLAASGARDPLYDIPHTTAHVGTFHGGTVLNIVPDRCVFDYEFRAIAADDPDALLAQVEHYARTVLEPEMQRIAPEAGFDFRFLSGFPGLDTQADAPVVGLAKHLAGRNDHAKVAYGTEAGLFASMARVPTVVVGPGDIDQAHKANEFIAVEQLQRCVGFVGRLVDHCAA